MSRIGRVLAASWIEVARQLLIERGGAAIKIDHLADRLGVTRGGFYHHFRDRDQLLTCLIEDWASNCRFLPEAPLGNDAAGAAAWLDLLIARLIEGDGYDHRYDLAMREWGRSDRRAAAAVECADCDRLQTLTAFFAALGRGGDEAMIRARVFYYHQIGYYAVGACPNVAERRRSLHRYLEILCGSGVIAAARASARLDRTGRLVTIGGR